MTDSVDVTIVGAGLTGLAVAHELREQGLSVLLAEARTRTGGRIDSVFEAGRPVADLGPTWVWPEYQPVIARWALRLKLTLYDQYDDGASILDAGPGHAVRLASLPGQAGSKRIVGGPQALIDSLARSIPSAALLSNCRIRQIDASGADLVCTDERGRRFRSTFVVVAAPARVAARDIRFMPDLPAAVSLGLSAVPTWMAQHAKVVMRYEQAFWRDRGLSGRLLSRAGPLAEVHDHSGPAGEPAALFGFAAWPHAKRAVSRREFEIAIAAQLTRCFGADAPEPLSIAVKDWAEDELVCTQQDLAEPAAHPRVQPALELDVPWRHRLWFACAEAAQDAPGLLAGALESAGQVSQAVLKASAANWFSPD